MKIEDIEKLCNEETPDLWWSYKIMSEMPKLIAIAKAAKASFKEMEEYDVYPDCVDWSRLENAIKDLERE